MAVKFGMTIAEIIAQLTRGFRSVAGRNPDGLEKIKIQQEAVQRFKEMNKVVDMQGRTLDPSKTIMGGTQEGAALKSGIMKATGAKPIEARADISKYIKDGKPDNDKLNALVDRDMILKEEADSLATKGENYERFQQISAERKNIREIIEDVRKMFPEDMAQGGRVGLKKGMDRRTFMKIMGGLATLPILGKFIKPVTKAAPAVKEAVTKAPDYFFALIDKIKRFGKSVDDAVADRRLEQTYRYKNYELRENAYGDPGETIVTKTDDMGEFGYKEESMRFKKGGQTEDGFVPDEYEELTVRPDVEGKLKDVEDGIEDVSEIIEEATKSSPPIKKAAGGIARMLGE